MNATIKSPLSRWGAALRHLIFTLAGVGLCFGTLLWLWYSPGLWSLASIPRALWLLLAALVVAAPLMTLVVYRHDKREIRTDMAIIIAIQLALFAYTVFAFGRVRPVFLVSAVDRLELVRAADLSDKDLAAASAPHYRQLSWTGPRLVGVKLPEDSNERYALIMSGLSGKDVQLMPKLYTDYENVASELLRYATPLDTLMQRDESSRSSLTQALSGAGRAVDNTRLVPIRGANNIAATMLLDADTGMAVVPVGVNPWEAPGSPVQTPARAAIQAN